MLQSKVGRNIFDLFNPRLFSRARFYSNLPSIAPRPTLNIKHVRENPELYQQTCIDRNYKAQKDNPFKIIELFERWKELQKNGRRLRERNNEIRTKLSHARTFSGRDAEKENEEPEALENLLEQAKELKAKITEIEVREEQFTRDIESLAADLPNLTSQETPLGNEARVVGYINEHLQPKLPSQDRAWRSHVYLGNEFDLLDFTAAATTTGWGWYYLKNEAALIEQALVQYALSVAMNHGFSIVSPPSIVYSHIAGACGFQPRDQGDEQQSYMLQQSEKNQDAGKPQLSLAGTAEVPFASMRANVIMEEKDLPLLVAGSSRCYRAEAGSRGVDTKGLYRVHEFTKVELFAWTRKEDEDSIFRRMLNIQEEILRSLGLRCRILEMPSIDLGASAVRKQDIEAFFPSREGKNGGWGEVTSTSICTDYQTRRLATRVKIAPQHMQSRLDFPSTINGTALAVPRVIAALLENGWNEKEMLISIPEILRPWMNGITVIKKHRQPS
ncbi:MAG: hypothetical protein LQ351_001308 [Letrouitia transgressa]|nr:MAG: hypothetical protein LQ351_001308 [Letrouitia transgressa]